MGYVKNMVDNISKLVSFSFMSMFMLSVQGYAATSDNPYVNKTTELIGKVKGWGLALVGAVTVIKIIQYGIQYQGGSSDEKQDAVKSIRKTFIMGGGIFFLVWFAGYVVEQYAGVTP